MIRIALVSPFTLPHYSGNSILVERLRKGLIIKGYNVAIFNSSNHNTDKAIKFSPHIIHSFNAERTNKWMRQFKAKHKGLWVISLTGTDYLTWNNNTKPPQYIQSDMEEANSIIVFHENALSILSQSLPKIKHKINIIAQGILSTEKKPDINSVYKKIGISLDNRIFLMVAGLRPVKNIQFAINAFREIENKIKNISLILIGPIIDTNEAKQILKLGKKLRCFKYLGELPPHEVREIMTVSDVFLNTSLHEGMSGAILESMAEGLPILASLIPGNMSLIKDNTNGLLFPLNDPSRLIDAVIELTNKPYLREKMGQAGKVMIEKHHSYIKEINNYNRLYLELLNKNNF